MPMMCAHNCRVAQDSDRPDLVQVGRLDGTGLGVWAVVTVVLWLPKDLLLCACGGGDAAAVLCCE